jgi:hypothetical protein
MLTALYPLAARLGRLVCRFDTYLHAWRVVLDDACPCTDHHGDAA